MNASRNCRNQFQRLTRLPKVVILRDWVIAAPEQLEPRAGTMPPGRVLRLDRVRLEARSGRAATLDTSLDRLWRTRAERRWSEHGGRHRAPGERGGLPSKRRSRKEARYRRLGFGMHCLSIGSR